LRTLPALLLAIPVLFPGLAAGARSTAGIIVLSAPVPPAAANPKNWPLDQMASMMRTHLDLTLKEGVAQLTGDYATSVSTYEQVRLEILQMADMLSAGIMAQFPSMFNGSLSM